MRQSGKSETKCLITMYKGRTDSNKRQGRISQNSDTIHDTSAPITFSKKRLILPEDSKLLPKKPHIESIYTNMSRFF